MPPADPTTSAAACRCDEWPDDHVHCHHRDQQCCHCPCAGQPAGVVLRTPVPWDVRWWLIGFVAVIVPAISVACMLSHRELMALPVMLLQALIGGIYAGVCAGRVSVWKHISEARDA